MVLQQMEQALQQMEQALLQMGLRLLQQVAHREETWLQDRAPQFRDASNHPSLAIPLMSDPFSSHG